VTVRSKLETELLEIVKHWYSCILAYPVVLLEALLTEDKPCDRRTRWRAVQPVREVNDIIDPSSTSPFYNMP